MASILADLKFLATAIIFIVTETIVCGSWCRPSPIINTTGYSTKYTLNFTNNDYLKYFELQYAYDQHNSIGQILHFNLTKYMNKSCLHIRVYKNDSSENKNSNTGPRSELREKITPMYYNKNIDYMFEWSYNLDILTNWQSFDGIINQYHPPNSDGPWLAMVANEDSYYEEYDDNGYNDHKGITKINKTMAKPYTDMNLWVNWLVQIRPSIDDNDGFINVYRNHLRMNNGTDDECVQIFERNGINARNGTDAYFKLGMYLKQRQNTSLYLTDVRVSTRQN
eukprot:144926_1